MLKKLLPFLTLFSSLGTLVCCALPALFVSLGLGATFVSVLGIFPQLIWLSEHKVLVFSIAGGFLLVAGLVRWKGERSSCPTDPNNAANCRRIRRSSTFIFYLSMVLYLIGGFFAFLAPKIL